MSAVKGIEVTLHWRDDERKPIPPILMLELVSPDGDVASQLLEPFEALVLVRKLTTLALAALIEHQSGVRLTHDEITERIQSRKDGSTP